MEGAAQLTLQFRETVLRGGSAAWVLPGAWGNGDLQEKCHPVIGR